ncbi:MAG TPA: hypothetical protein VFY83_08330 [Anaerolineales bacterium]|nr:hypothetical protein [Anaerolineales bacterium]
MFLKWLLSLSGLFWTITPGISFNADDAGGGGSTTDADKSSTSPKPETAPEKPEKGSRTFTQDEVQSIGAEEKRQGKKEGEQAATAALLEKLKKAGIEVDSIDKMTELLLEDKKRRDAEMSETERLQKALEKAEADAKTAAEALAKREAEARVDRRDGKVREALTKANIRTEEVDDALLLMEKRSLLDDLLLDDGTVDAKKLEAAITKFKSEKPALFGPITGIPSGKGGRAPNADEARKNAVQRQKQFMK